jgi:predicted RNA-binding protein with RPS1 domain
LAHVSEIDVEGDSLEDEFQLGDWVSARILRVEDEDKKVGLTMRGVDQPSEEEAAAMEAEWVSAQAALSSADEVEDDGSEEEE